jgi:hypothetical protein
VKKANLKPSPRASILPPKRASIRPHIDGSFRAIINNLVDHGNDLMNYNRFTLRFTGDDGGLEAEFLDINFRNCLTLTRFSLLVGLIFYAAFGVLDAVLLPELKYTTWFIRYAVVCPVIFFVILFSYHAQYKKYWQASLILVISAAGLGIIFMIAIAPQLVSFSYYAGLILVIIFCYAFFRTRFIWASITCWALVALYEIVSIWIVETPFPVLLNNNFFFIGASIVGMFICYSIENQARRNFYLQHLLEREKTKVTKSNKELEEKILEVEKASAKIKKLTGLLPICARCKKIRDDKGYWNQIEEYITTHSEAEFSHGFCPECAKELYSDFMKPEID